MRSKKLCLKRFAAAVPALAALFFSPAPAFAQTFPDKPITIYCGYAAGATTDLTARGLAQGAEKLLGVPVVVENKPGGAATVAAALVASKKGDGYTLGVTSTAALTMRPHLMKLGYNGPKDFTVLMQYSRFIGALCVLKDAPWKNIEEFIAYARKHPGMAYASNGMYTQQQLAVEILRQCKGLEFKHMPTKGGTEANTALLGKHVEFIPGAGSHLPLVKQGVFRQLLILNSEKRDPDYPDLPTMKEIGCPDNPANGYIVMGPKAMPEAVNKKLGEVFKKVAESAEFKKLLDSYDLPYDYKDQKQLAKEIPAEFDWYKGFLQKMGIKKE
jgi:tripartite-type tricarboxylate transporter receptor subunit TctC